MPFLVLIVTTWIQKNIMVKNAITGMVKRI